MHELAQEGELLAWWRFKVEKQEYGDEGEATDGQVDAETPSPRQAPKKGVSTRCFPGLGRRLTDCR